MRALLHALIRGGVWLTLAVLAPIAQSSPREVVERETQTYYSQWVGVQAPEFNQSLKDRVRGRPVRIQDYAGKRLILFSFDAGDFVSQMDTGAVVPKLSALDHVRKGYSAGLAVIGFTYGAAFFLPGAELAPEIKSLTDFPVINNTNVELQEPYNLLQRWPSVVVIDQHGVIVDIQSKIPTEAELTAAVQKPDWTGKMHAAPQSGPPESVKNYSSRKPFMLYVYRKDISKGDQFQREFGKIEAMGSRLKS